MALESVEALAVRARLSESHCHPSAWSGEEAGERGAAQQHYSIHRRGLHVDGDFPGGWRASEGGVGAGSALWNRSGALRALTHLIDGDS